MAVKKPLKLRISSLITYLRSCNSKPTTISAVNFPVSKALSNSNTHHSSSAFKRHLPSSAGCRPTPRTGDYPPASRKPQEFIWTKEEKWHVVFPPPSTTGKKKRRPRKKKSTAAAIMFRPSTSSSEEERETMFSSSRTFSTDSSGRSKTRRSTSRRRSSASSPESELPAARLSAFKKLIPCTVDGKVKESFAVLKKSRDPQGDFKRSMMEMIVEKELFEKKELEQLLECLLSLNGRQYHGFIVGAFSEIWEDLFC
ncbi:unnamed protein product [Cuscuta europaea]|uniref:Transcription repressor n=1 Tax=Cuscuta europaea TaxID=41803 RepID=A0A9P1EH85_CUSEU|nr:unnamed protein product [Cuscuta europaea]